MSLLWFCPPPPPANLMAVSLHVCAGPTLVNMGKGTALGQFPHVGVQEGDC